MSNAIDDRTDSVRSGAIRLLRVDDGALAGAVADRLEQRGRRVAVTSVRDATAAAEAIAAEPVDCALVDWAVVGEAFVRDLRARDESLPCVVFVGDEAGDVAERALTAGATDVVRADAEPGPAVVARRVEQFVDGYRARRRAADGQDELREKANLLDQLFEQIPAALYVKDRQGRHVRMSDYDVEPETVIGKTDPEIYGDTVFARETLRDDLQVIRTGEPIVNKEEYNVENGEWTITSKVPWYGEDGQIQGLIGVSRLVTEKKEYEHELERTNDRLEKFAGIVSHDLQSPLNVATGHLGELRESVDHESVDQIECALDRVQALVDDLLTLARQGQTIDETGSVEMECVVDRAWASVRTPAASVEVEQPFRVDADEPRLLECLENLFQNAVEHGSTSPRSQAREDAVEHGSTSPRSQAHEDAPERDGTDVHVRVGPTDDGFYVADDGVGVPAEDREAVFQEGATTSEDGTGYGLAIVREIASAHGWTVELAESRDGGARFEFGGVDVER